MSVFHQNIVCSIVDCPRSDCEKAQKWHVLLMWWVVGDLDVRVEKHVETDENKGLPCSDALLSHVHVA